MVVHRTSLDLPDTRACGQRIPPSRTPLRRDLSTSATIRSHRLGSFSVAHGASLPFNTHLQRRPVPEYTEQGATTLDVNSARTRPSWSAIATRWVLPPTSTTPTRISLVHRARLLDLGKVKRASRLQNKATDSRGPAPSGRTPPDERSGRGRHFRPSGSPWNRQPHEPHPRHAFILPATARARNPIVDPASPDPVSPREPGQTPRPSRGVLRRGYRTL